MHLADNQAARVCVGARRPAVSAHRLPHGTFLLTDVPVGCDSSVTMQTEAGLGEKLVHRTGCVEATCLANENHLTGQGVVEGNTYGDTGLAEDVGEAPCEEG